MSFLCVLPNIVLSNQMRNKTNPGNSCVPPTLSFCFSLSTERGTQERPTWMDIKMDKAAFFQYILLLFVCFQIQCFILVLTRTLSKFDQNESVLQTQFFGLVLLSFLHLFLIPLPAVHALKTNKALMELHLSNNQLNGYQDAMQLGDLLQYNNTLQTLELSNNMLADAGKFIIFTTEQKKIGLSNG